jgi:hypothetical protein
MIEIIIGIVCVLLIIIVSIFMYRRQSSVDQSSSHYPTKQFEQSNLEKEEIECRRVLPADECRWQRMIFEHVNKRGTNV